jgi:uncharacterized protein
MSYTNNSQSLKKIKVTPIAAESLGVRSMCTLVETPDVTILLDAGVSLCPYRFNLPPHPKEFQTINRLRQNIAQAAKKANVITISHYHFDHHTPAYTDWLVNWTETDKTAKQIYQNKQVLIKNPKNNIKANQRQRAWIFQTTVGQTAESIQFADGKTFLYGKTTLKFSEAVFHGSTDSVLGWIIMALVEFEGERFVFAPDVQGPMIDSTREWVEAAQPSLLIVGGPPTNLESFRIDPSFIDAAVQNLCKLAKVVPLIVLEHHALRDKNYRELMNPVFETALKAGNRVVTSAEYLGVPNVFLESQRCQLFQDYPVFGEFKVWMETLNDKDIKRPPI